MKTILVIGATGMLGHKLALKLSRRYKVAASVRGAAPAFFAPHLCDRLEIIEGIDAFRPETAEQAIRAVKPDYVLNCVGIVKQLAEAKDPVTSITVNALFPHQLEKLAEKHDFKLIHFSTDCVFSGKKGPYSQTAPSDVNDLYGMTKFLGEVSGPRALTLRSSIIGREFASPTGLIEWFLAQKGGAIKGYGKALYTGLTTNAMADLVTYLIEHKPALSGLYQVASEEISKYDLLQLVNETAESGVSIEKDEDFFCDRRLDGKEFHKASGWSAQPWPDMIKTMFDEDRLFYITTP
ncbi:MAG: SDR family oxidoreductase [Micavibrio sp.]